MQDREFRLPAHKARQATGGGHLQAPPQGTGPDQLEDLHGLRQPLHRHRSQGGDLHQSLRQPQRLGGQANTPGVASCSMRAARCVVWPMAE